MPFKFIKVQLSKDKYEKVFHDLYELTGKRYKTPEEITKFCVWFAHQLFFNEVVDDLTPFDLMLDLTFYTKRMALRDAENEFVIFSSLPETSSKGFFDINIPEKEFKPLLEDMKSLDRNNVIPDIITEVRFCLWEVVLLFTRPQINDKTAYDLLRRAWYCEINHDKNYNLMDFFHKGYEKFCRKK